MRVCVVCGEACRCVRGVVKRCKMRAVLLPVHFISSLILLIYVIINIKSGHCMGQWGTVQRINTMNTRVRRHESRSYTCHCNNNNNNIME